MTSPFYPCTSNLPNYGAAIMSSVFLPCVFLGPSVFEASSEGSEKGLEKGKHDAGCREKSDLAKNLNEPR